jgi:hypothetical protein
MSAAPTNGNGHAANGNGNGSAPGLVFHGSKDGSLGFFDVQVEGRRRIFQVEDRNLLKGKVADGTVREIGFSGEGPKRTQAIEEFLANTHKTKLGGVDEGKVLSSTSIRGDLGSTGLDHPVANLHINCQHTPAVNLITRQTYKDLQKQHVVPHGFPVDDALTAAEGRANQRSLAKNVVRNAGNEMGDWIKPAVNVLATAGLTALWVNFASKMSIFQNGVDPKTGKASNNLGEFVWYAGAAILLAATVGTAVKSLQQWGQKLQGNAVNAADTGIQTGHEISTKVSNVPQMASDAAHSAVEKGKAAFDTILPDVIDRGIAAGAGAVQSLNNAMTGLASKIPGLGNSKSGGVAQSQVQAAEAAPKGGGH